MAEHDAIPMIHTPWRGPSRGFLADCCCGWRSRPVPTLDEAQGLADQHSQVACCCHGGPYGPQEHPFLVHPDCPIHAANRQVGDAS